MQINWFLHMTAFHPESVYYEEERCPPGEFAGESWVVVWAVPHPSGAAGAPQLPALVSAQVAAPEEGEALAIHLGPG